MLLKILIWASVRAFMPLWKVAAPLEEIREDHFRNPKTAEDELNLLKESIPKSTVHKNKWPVKVFREWIASRIEVLVLDPGGALKDYCDLHKVQPLSTGWERMDSCSLTNWLSIFVQEVTNAEGERYPARTFYGIIVLIIIICL